MRTVLDRADTIAGTHCGLRRAIDGDRHKDKLYSKSFSENVELHLFGAMAEVAFAKIAGVDFRCSSMTFTQPDFGPFEIRRIRERGNPLPIRKSTPDDSISVLIYGEGRFFEIVGWIRTADGKRPEFWETGKGRPYYWSIPQDALNPPNAELEKLIEEWRKS